MCCYDMYKIGELNHLFWFFRMIKNIKDIILYLSLGEKYE